MSKQFQPQHIAFLGDYLPRLCGIATFTYDLCEAVAVAAPEADCFVGAVNDRAEGYNYPDRVRFELQEKEIDSYRRAADFLPPESRRGKNRPRPFYSRQVIQIRVDRWWGIANRVRSN